MWSTRSHSEFIRSRPTSGTSSNPNSTDILKDLCMEHTYIKPGKPQHNGKVERSHLTDKIEFYQLLGYSKDVDLNKKIRQWEDFDNFERPPWRILGKDTL
ncbi:integrase core domain-containing protein [Flagellimonas marinaquae]|nr:integrase core domain-containing protein [Allomuricauda aquimarina]